MKEAWLFPSSVILRQLCSAVDDPLALPPVVMVAAHPDDEVIGAGSRLARLGGSVMLIYLTNGAPGDLGDARANGYHTREDYAAARRRELACALSLAGIAMDQTVQVGLADQEASLYLDALADTLASHFSEYQPGAVITHPYEGGHPDHDAAAFAVQAAAHLMRMRGEIPPALIEMTSYHLGPEGIETGEFLPGENSHVHTVELAEDERRLKRRMLDCFTTQRETLRYFKAERERFRAAPNYDFTRPPHEGKLFYEHYEWGMDGPRWRELARASLQELGVISNR